MFGKFDPMPNRKTDTNNHGPFSTDNIGRNYDYPEASYERRREILAEHERYQKGYHYFLSNDPRLPDDVRERLIANCRRRVTRDGDLLITSQRFRDRGRNVAACTETLRALLLAAAVAPRRRKPTRPTRSSLERRREAKQRISKQKRLRRVPPRDGD